MRSRLASPVAPAVTVRPRTRAALIVATSGAVLLGAAVPAAIALPSGSRSSTHVRGTVERIHLDDFGQPGMAGNDQLTFVRNGDGMVQVPAADLGSVPTGATVDVALASDDGLAHTAAGSYTTTFGGAAAHDPHAGVDVAAVQVAPVAPGAVATGSGLAAANYAVAAGIAPHSVEVVMVQLPGTTGPSISGASVVATVNGAVNSYWNTVTRGAATFTSTAYSTVVTTTHVPCSTIGGSTSINGTDAFWSEVETKVGFTAGSGRHLLVYFDHTTACGGIAGLASLGSTIASGGDVWINGYNELDVIGHELGHNLSLGHSELLDCTTAGVRVTDTTDPATCGARGYADTNDIMAIAWGNSGYLNASHLRHLGLLTATDQKAPSAAGVGTATLTPLETPGSLRVLTLTSGGTRYVVEFRRPVGLDTWLSYYPSWGSSGVTVRKEFDQSNAATRAVYDPFRSYLLDGNPITPDTGWGSLKATLATGVWVELAGGQLAVRVGTITPTTAVVDYRIGPSSGDPNYTPPPRPIVSAPVGALVPGVTAASATGVNVPVRWRYTVTTPAVSPAVNTSVVSLAPVTRNIAGNGISRVIAFRAAAAASDGSLVTARSALNARYLGEATPILGASYSRGWGIGALADAMGRRTRVTSSKGSAVAFHVTGRSVGVLLAHGPAYGAVAIYVDGKHIGTWSLRATRTAVAMAWAKSFSTSGRHLVTLVNMTGGARGHLGFDGVVTLS